MTRLNKAPLIRASIFVFIIFFSIPKVIKRERIRRKKEKKNERERERERERDRDQE